MTRPSPITKFITRARIKWLQVRIHSALGDVRAMQDAFPLMLEQIDLHQRCIAAWDRQIASLLCTLPPDPPPYRAYGSLEEDA